MTSFTLMNMKPCYRTLLSYKINPFTHFRKVSTFLNIKKPNFSNTHMNNYCLMNNSTRVLDFTTVLSKSQMLISAPKSTRGWSGILSNTCCRNFITRPSFVVSSNAKNFSTFVEKGVNDKNFERIYVQSGLNVKKPLVDKFGLDENGVRNERVIESECVKVEKEESEIEREAWNLLRNAVVTYCGSPVGTVAANDPNDKLPLNYDQVFIRDFIPSAFAFLLKGEGEIVRNFLLHTLQLQSWEKTVDCYSPGQGLMPASFTS